MLKRREIISLLKVYLREGGVKNILIVGNFKYLGGGVWRSIENLMGVYECLVLVRCSLLKIMGLF